MGLFSRKNKQERVAEDSGRFYSKDDDAAIGERARAKRASNAGAGAGRRPGNDPMLPEKKRARRRLVGAIALALAAAVGLPMLLDSQPKPLAGDIAIQIPAKDKAAPLPVPAADKSVTAADSVDKGEEVVDAAPAAAAPIPPAPRSALNSGAQPDPRTVTPPATAPAGRTLDPHLEAKPDTKADARLAERERAERERADKDRADKARAERDKAERERADRDRAERAEREARLDKPVKPKPDDKPAKPARPQDDAARAMAILEGKSAAKPVEKDHPADAAGQRFVVQAAAMSSAEKAAEVQAKLREAGIASYTEKAAAGGLIRVRVGPLSREDAEKMRARVGHLGYSGNLIPL